MATAEIRPDRLKCEYLSNPLGIGEPSPRLSWILRSEKRKQVQSAYQVLVADSEEDLGADRGTLWDTGKVASSESVNIAYKGERLESGARCCWKVRVWDGEDRPSPFSETGFWEMGLLDSSDWRAAWIGLGDEARGDVDPPSGELVDDVLRRVTPSPYLRREFVVERPVRRARIYATARGLYELYLNGSRVGDAVLAPGWTDYNLRIQYQTYDVTDLLLDGDNAIGGILGEGWYCGYVGMDPKRRGAHYGSRPELLLQLHVEHEDGTSTTLVSDGSWRCTTGPILMSDLLMGEIYDAEREMDGWSKPGFDDSEWFPVSVDETLGAAKLVAEPAQPVQVTGELPARSVHRTGPGKYIFDMGQNMVGRVRLKVSGQRGTAVTLRHAEVLEPGGGIYTENLRFARQSDTYILRGEREEVFEPRFTFHGFRYVEVSGYPGEPPLDAVTGVVIHSGTPLAGRFECSDEMVNQLQRNIVWGQRGNFLSVPTDCPQRDERLGWMGDAQIFVRTASFNMDVSSFFTKWMADVEDAQTPEGAFPDVAPKLVVETDGAPAWGDAGIILPWTVYRVYGDTRIIERHYDAMVRWIDYIRRHNPDLLRARRLNNNYGDWLSVGQDTPKEVLATAYFAYDARLLAEMARAIGRDDDAKRYEKLFRDIRSAFIRAYVAEDGRIKGDTQTCYVLALHMDLLPEDLRPLAADHLVRNIREKGWHLSTGFLGVGYLCPVLTETGHADVAYRLLHQDTFPSWGYSIRHGATTIWERWDGWTEENGFQSPNMNSFNHYSLGSVGEWLYRYVAGIDLDPDEPGYRRIVIRPRPGGHLTSARGEYNSVRGKIVSDWELADDELRLRVSIPANTSATVYVPGQRAEISEGGKPADRAEGVEFLRTEDGATVFVVGSGHYEFLGGNIR